MTEEGTRARAWTLQVQLGPVLLPGGSSRVLVCEVDAPSIPVRLRVDKALVRGLHVRNVVLTNAGLEVLLMDGRPWLAELFDGATFDGIPRDLPYERLPKVPADAGSKIFVHVYNPTADDDRWFGCTLEVEKLA